MSMTNHIGNEIRLDTIMDKKSIEDLVDICGER